MGKKKVFIDGSSGTTGLRINERFQGRDDIEIMQISEDKRKDPAEIKKFINESDITFLCLPDDAAREAVTFVENPDTVILDTSTAHRTEAGWAYGFPELSDAHKEAIVNGKRIAVPGCYASGVIALAYPLIKSGMMPADYPLAVFAVSGYSGGGKKLISTYEEAGRDKCFDSARMYGLTQMHKHLKEMKIISGLKTEPLFSPLTTNYHSGMVVQIPLYSSLLKGTPGPDEIRSMLAEHYKGQKFMKVFTAEEEEGLGGVMFSDKCAGWDGMELHVNGNDDRILLSTRFDNLGKGASGAAVECMNLVLGCDPAKGLDL